MLDLRLLRAFVAVAETENIGRAAEQLNISQSPLSRQIMQLEDFLGLSLFERVRQRIRLTDEGRSFLEDARRLLAHADETERAAQRLAQGETGHLAIGYVEGAMHAGILPQALGHLTAARPDARIALHPLSSREQHDALSGRKIDVGLAYSAPEDGALASKKVLDEPLLLALSPDHSLAGLSVLSASNLDGAGWIALSMKRNSAARLRFLDHCRASGFCPDIQIETEDLFSALRLVACGLGVTFVQASLRDALPGRVTFREVPWFASRVALYAIWRKDDPKPLVGKFEQILSDLTA